jgi:hypothetical protein
MCYFFMLIIFFCNTVCGDHNCDWDESVDTCPSDCELATPTCVSQCNGDEDCIIDCTFAANTVPDCRNLSPQTNIQVMKRGKRKKIIFIHDVEFFFSSLDQ